MNADLLIELGTEELPPKALLVLSQHFTAETLKRLAAAGLVHGAHHAFATPRRLALLIEQVPVGTPPQKVERRGPALAAAFGKDGTPSGAALGFAKSCGVDIDALERLQTDKGEWLVYRSEAPGQPLASLLPSIVEAALAALPIPKRMRWGEETHEFVRPVHWLVLLHGSDVVPASLFGVHSGRTTRGHRFMGEARIEIDRPARYAALLQEAGKVIPAFQTRRERVRELVEAAATDEGGRALFDEALLDEVTALVEWPSAIVGSFDPHFLEVPREALVASMQGHQKYFPLEAPDGRLLNRFVTIANIDSPRPELIRAGNERVIRPRLSDAAFFWHKDKAQSLASHLQRLADTVFERRLGSLGEKSERVAALATALAQAFGADQAAAARTGLLSRCDLVSEMVGEFPELQGTMGSYYAANDGEPAAVVQALREFYQPRFAGDEIPGTPTGRAVALADKLDTLTGIFGIGSAPTGDKDPYALRRAALGCLRICIEADAPLDLASALETAAAGHGSRISAEAAAQVFDFMLERARGYFTDRGWRPDVVESVLMTRPATPREMARRIKAVEAFLELPESAALAGANKRIGNLLRKVGGIPVGAADAALLVEPAEQALARELAQASAETAEAAGQGDYVRYLARLARLHAPVNAFFDGVLVMVDDERLRTARLQLLRDLRALFLRVADLSVIAA